MADEIGNSKRNGEADDGSRIWRGLRSLLFGESEELTLREQLEDVIAGHDAEAGAPAAADGKGSDLNQVERQMLTNMLHFGELNADDVCVPRSDMVAIAEGASFGELVALFVEAGHSRIPVYRDSRDNIVGMVHIRDAFRILAEPGQAPDALAGLIRQPLYVPVSMGVLDLLAEMRATRTHLAIVLDEYSGTEGLVTIEDLMEEIVGDIEDEHDDAPATLVTELQPGLWDADARAELDDVGAIVAPELAVVGEDVDTLGGLVFVLAGRVPQPGELVSHPSGWGLEIIDGDERRVTRMRLHAPRNEAPGETL